jgi:SAM-dependent methyltransferase
MAIGNIMTCRICNGNVEGVLDLGNIYPSNFIPKNDSELNYTKQPLKLVKCTQCDLVQLEKNPPLDSMYRQYWYKSSLNKSMVASLQNVIDSIEYIIPIEDNDVVVDIGCNDGTMLSQYSNKKLIKVGFDPALNLKEEASSHCDLFINDYFDAARYSLPIKAKVATAIACFYDLEDPNKFIEDVKSILQSNGVFVIQFTDLLNTMWINGFDNIVHEHIEYYSFKVICDLMEKHGLEVFDAEMNNVNGGSIRAFIGFKGVHTVSHSVIDTLNIEDAYMDKFENPFTSFKERVESIKETTVSFIKKEARSGKRIFVMGASTKGNTLLQYFGLDNTLIQYACEVNKDKYGLKTLGSNIEIISEEEALQMNPDYFLILPWHFVSGFRKIHENYLDKGGKFIIPCPEFTIVSNSWE